MRSTLLLVLIFCSLYLKAKEFDDTLISESQLFELSFSSEDFEKGDSSEWHFYDELFSVNSKLIANQAGLDTLRLFACDILTNTKSFSLSYYDFDLTLYDQSICPGDTAFINFPTGDFSMYNDFVWNFEGQFLSEDSTISIFEEGLYEIRFYGSDTLLEQFELTYYDSSSPDLSFSDTTICELENISLEFSLANYESYFDFEWYGPDGFYSTDSVTEFSTAGTYILEVFGCESLSDTFQLTVIPNDTLDFSFPDSLICEGDTLLVEFPSGDFSSYNDFTWYLNDDVFEMESDSSIVITNPGEYSLHLNGCPYLSDNFIVNFYEFPLLMSDSELNVDSVIYICLEEDPVIITPFEDFPHTWYLDGISFDTDIYNERTLILEEILDQINLNQVYTYDVEIDFECGVVAANNTVDVSVVECECGLDMPNVFTPDGNDNNDYFKPFNNYEGESVDPESLCMSTDFHMEIFNQWGKHIVSIDSNDELPYWDGLNTNGNEMNAGVYFYRITYQVNIYSLPEKKEITGYFHLFK